MPTVRDEAVCIRQWDWSETSQTVSLFGRQTGVVRAIAKGSKRENSRFSGGLEVLTRGEFLANIKPGSGEGLALLTAWDLQETFPATRASLSAFYAGMAMLDLIHHAVHDSDPHPGLYDALVVGLRQLGGAAGDGAALLALLWAVLAETGHTPELWRDVRAGVPLSAAASYAFTPRLGGLVVDESAVGGGAGRASEPTPGPVWRVRGETVELLRRVAGQGGLNGQSIDQATATRAARLLAMYFREVFSCDPPALARLLTDGP